MSLLDAVTPWSRRSSTGADWVGVYPVGGAGGERILAVHGSAPKRRPARPMLHAAPAFEGGDAAAALLQWQRGHCRHARANVLFTAADYRIVPLETPPVPAAERRDALRWQLRDLIDFPVDEASIASVDVPGATLGAASRQVFAVASSADLVRRWMQRYRDSRLKLGAIDIPEMALRNLSVHAAGDDAHAFVHLGLNATRLIVVWQRELCSFRRFDGAGFRIERAHVALDGDMLERLALEIQRSTDAFSRLFHGADLKQVWISAPRDVGAIAEQLGQLLPQTVTPLRPTELIDLHGIDAVVDIERGLDYTVAIGAALRQEH